MSFSRWRQQISSGGAFDGTAPPGAHTVSANGVNEYAAAATGGLFDPGNTTGPVWLERFLWHSATATAWTLFIITADGDVVVLGKGTADTDWVSGANDRVELAVGDKLKLVTTGGAFTQVAEATFQDRLIE